MQATLRDTLHFKGVGLHTGAQAAVAVQPAGSDEGLSFISGETRIPATVEYVSDTSRATVLSRNGVSVSTTEHLLSALFAMGVTIAGHSGVWGDIAEGATVSGDPAHDHREELRRQVMIRRLPKLFDRVEALERSHLRQTE